MLEVTNLIPITVINKPIGFKNAIFDYLLQAELDPTAEVGGALSEKELAEISPRSRSSQLGSFRFSRKEAEPCCKL